jgi:hypothetical protein
MGFYYTNMTTSDEDTLIMKTLKDNCDCIPSWMDAGDAFFEPMATLIIANRISPLLQALIGKLFSTSSEGVLMHRFLALPDHVQFSIETSLKLMFADMPPIKTRTSNGGYVTSSSNPTLEPHPSMPTGVSPNHPEDKKKKGTNQLKVSLVRLFVLLIGWKVK